MNKIGFFFKNYSAIIFVLFLFLATPIVVFAVKLEINWPHIPGAVSPSEGADFPQFIKYFYIFGIAISGITALGVFIFAGLEWMTSAGNTNKIKEAKERIKAAVIGVLLLLGSYLILSFINPEFTQLKLADLEFKISQPPPIPPPPQKEPPPCEDKNKICVNLDYPFETGANKKLVWDIYKWEASSGSAFKEIIDKMEEIITNGENLSAAIDADLNSFISIAESGASASESCRATNCSSNCPQYTFEVPQPPCPPPAEGGGGGGAFKYFDSKNLYLSAEMEGLIKKFFGKSKPEILAQEGGCGGVDIYFACNNKGCAGEACPGRETVKNTPQLLEDKKGEILKKYDKIITTAIDPSTNKPVGIIEQLKALDQVVANFGQNMKNCETKNGYLISPAGLASYGALGSQNEIITKTEFNLWGDLKNTFANKDQNGKILDYRIDNYKDLNEIVMSYNSYKDYKYKDSFLCLWSI